MTVEERLKELGIELPEQAPAGGLFRSAVLHGGLLFVSGHGPYRDGEYVYRGKVDSEVTVEDATKAAELSIVNALASVRRELGSLDRVEQVVKLLGMVNSDPRFEDQSKVIDGASALLAEVFGDRSGHARSAVGMSALPMSISVEIEMILAVH